MAGLVPGSAIGTYENDCDKSEDKNNLWNLSAAHTLIQAERFQVGTHVSLPLCFLRAFTGEPRLPAICVFLLQVEKILKLLLVSQTIPCKVRTVMRVDYTLNAPPCRHKPAYR